MVIAKRIIAKVGFAPYCAWWAKEREFETSGGKLQKYSRYWDDEIFVAQWMKFFACKNKGIYTIGSNRQQPLMNTLLKPRKGRCYQALSYYQWRDIRKMPAVCFSPYLVRTGRQHASLGWWWLVMIPWEIMLYIESKPGKGGMTVASFCNVCIASHVAHGIYWICSVEKRKKCSGQQRAHLAVILQGFCITK